MQVYKQSLQYKSKKSHANAILHYIFQTCIISKALKVWPTKTTLTFTSSQCLCLMGSMRLWTLLGVLFESSFSIVKIHLFVLKILWKEIINDQNFYALVFNLRSQ